MGAKKGSSNHLRLEYLIKHIPFIQLMYRVIMSAAFRILGIFIPIDKNLVLMNGHGYKYNDSPRTIYKRMLELGLLDKYKVVWALKDPDAVDIEQCKKIKIDTPEYFITALKAKYWVSCVNIERGLKFKKKNTVYMNTWHGAAINVCGNGVSGRRDFQWDYINYFCSCGKYDDEYFARDFNLNKNAILKCGYPRNDILYKADVNYRKEIRKKFNVPEDKKVILYAPTWRESDDGGKTFQLVPPINWSMWEEQLSDKYILMLRTHPYTTELMNVEFNDFLRDYTVYPEVNDLLIVADILISDYSSIILDYSITCKPLICFGYDYDKYSKARGFYYDLEKEMPNGVFKTEDEVLSHIESIDFERECEKTRKFKDDHMEYGGNATNECIEKLFGIKL